MAGGATSATLWTSFAVRFEFPVVFADGVFDPKNSALAEALALREAGKRHRCLVFVDEGVLLGQPDLLHRIRDYFDAFAEVMVLAAAPEVMPGGEQLKTDAKYHQHISALIHDANIDRHSFVIAIGGGALLDVVGLACATAHRGTRHIRIPTTVLAQNHSAVGVKNAVNSFGVKNYTGTFAPPWAVINDHRFIDCLPSRERIAGLAEAVKVALIRDRAFFEWMEANADKLAAFEPEAERYMIRRCAALHIRQITESGDPFETGSARPLTFGHWAAHKLEAQTEHALGHGEAVAVGIALDTCYSMLKGLLPDGGGARVLRLLKALGLSIYHPALRDRGAKGPLALLSGLDLFRAHLGGDLTVTLLAAVGTGVEVHDMDPIVIAAAIDRLEAEAVT